MPRRFDPVAVDTLIADLAEMEAVLTKSEKRISDEEALTQRVASMVKLQGDSPDELALAKAQALNLVKAVVRDYGVRGGQAIPYDATLAWELRKAHKVTPLEVERWKSSGYLPDHVAMEDTSISPHLERDRLLEDLAKSGVGIPPISRLAAAHNPKLALLLIAQAALAMEKATAREEHGKAVMLARRGW